MQVAFLTDPDCASHDTGYGHPESPARLRAVLDYLPTSDIWNRLTRPEVPTANEKEIRERLYRVHDRDYVDAIFSAQPTEGRVYLDPDTSIAPHSVAAAVCAVNSVLLGVDLVMSRAVDRAFCCVRPPGHHAETRRAMGFCLFNNIAVGARYAQEHYGLDRVAVVDFDVHHGNGTEEIFRGDSTVMICSTFQHPFYPGSGANTKSDHIVNVPLPAGTDGPRFRAAFDEKIRPALNRFQPQLVLCSAGFDGHQEDPLAQLALREEDFAWVTRRIAEIADSTARGRVVSTLEGGYDLSALPRSVDAHLQALMSLS